MKKHLLALFASVLLSTAVRAQLVVQSFPFPNNSSSNSGVAIDPLDNIITSGSYIESAPQTPTILSVVRKKNPVGNLMWYGRVAAGGPIGKYTCTDAAGNIYVYGLYAGLPMQLTGGSLLPHYGSQDVFLAKYSPNGVLLWSQSMGGAGNESPNGIGCDAAGNVIIAGTTYSSQITLGGSVTLTAANAFVAKFTPSGAIVWAEPVVCKLPGGNTRGINAMDVSPLGEIYITGHFNAVLTIGTTNYPDATQGLFIAKLDSSGVPVWTKRTNIPTSCESRGDAISVDSAGDVFIFGTYSIGNFTFDGVAMPVAAGTPSLATWNTFVFNYTSAGSFVWARPIISNILGSVVPFTPTAIQALGHGKCLFSGAFNSSITIGSTVFNTSATHNNIFLAELNAQGEVNWGIIGEGTSPLNEIPTDIAISSQQFCFLTGYIPGAGAPGGNSISFGGYTSIEHGSFLYKIKTGQGLNLVSGKAFYDTNLNGIKEAGEAYVVGNVVQAQPNYIYTSSQITGQYEIFVDTGAFTIAPTPLLYYTAVPASYTVSFNSLGNSDTTRHFAIQPIPGMQDLQVTLSSLVPPRPGFAFPLHITYRNLGTIAMSGSVDLVLDPLLVYQNSTPFPASVAANVLSWSFTNLQPTQSASIVVFTQVPATTALGTTLSNDAQVNPLAGDLTPQDNSAALRSIVVGSFDPNDKQVSDSILTPTEVAAGKYLDYTIRFQNTGTDTAFVVRIIDTLDTQLNIPTFELLQSSHSSTWSIRGNGIVEFRFENILLPDSNTNEPLSHGFVKYRIKPRTNLALGDVIRNTAGIYFDFNEAVITNTVTTEVALVSGLAAAANRPQLHVYPNPNKGEFMLQLKGLAETEVKAELRNVLGQAVWAQKVPVVNGSVRQLVQTSGLSKGVYYLQVSSSQGNAVQKVVVE